NARGDIEQSHLRALAGSNEMAFSASRLRILFFVHSRADRFVSDHRKRKSPPHPRLFFLRTHLRYRALEHGIALNHLRRALGSAFSSTHIFYSNFRRLRWRFHGWLRAGA